MYYNNLNSINSSISIIVYDMYKCKIQNNVLYVKKYLYICNSKYGVVTNVRL